MKKYIHMVEHEEDFDSIQQKMSMSQNNLKNTNNE
jgi:hypothetical protein